MPIQIQGNWRVSCSVGGLPLGVFDTWDPPETTAEDTRYQPGGMVNEVVLASKRTRGNATLTRAYMIGRDDVNNAYLDAAVGTKDVVITAQPLDADRAAIGVASTYTGRLIRYKGAGHESSTGDPSVIELEVAVTNMSDTGNPAGQAIG